MAGPRRRPTRHPSIRADSRRRSAQRTDRSPSDSMPRGRSRVVANASSSFVSCVGLPGSPEPRALRTASHLGQRTGRTNPRSRPRRKGAAGVARFPGALRLRHPGWLVEPGPLNLPPSRLLQLVFGVRWSKVCGDDAVMQHRQQVTLQMLHEPCPRRTAAPISKDAPAGEANPVQARIVCRQQAPAEPEGGQYQRHVAVEAGWRLFPPPDAL